MQILLSNFLGFFLFFFSGFFFSFLHFGNYVVNFVSVLFCHYRSMSAVQKKWKNSDPAQTREKQLQI